MQATVSVDHTDGEKKNAALRNWQRTALRVRSMTRFRLLRTWSQQVDRTDNPVGTVAAAKLAAYERVGVLGVGGAAVVYLVRHRTSQTLYALKVQSCPMKQPWSRRTFHARKEQYILQMLRHPFVGQLHEAFHDTTRLYLVLAYHPGGSLANVQGFCGGTLSEHAVQFYAAEIVHALEYVHTVGFVYRDLKPQNVLIGSDGHIRLTDFGVAHEGLPVDPSRYYPFVDTSEWLSGLGEKQCNGDDATTTTTVTTASVCEGDPGLTEDDLTPADTENVDSDDLDAWETEHSSERPMGVDDRVLVRSNSFVGTVEYMPPEMIQQVSTQSSDVDWWALGCLMYELLYGVSPFQHAEETSTKSLFRRILIGRLVFPAFPRVSNACKDLIRRLLVVDPRHRLGHRQGSTQVKAHVFFHGHSWAYHSREPPVRVTHCCMIHSSAEDNNEPPFLNEENNDEDDAAWRHWNEAQVKQPFDPLGCKCNGERYVLVTPPLSRVQAFFMAQSHRFGSFRFGDKTVTIGRSESML